MVRAGRSREPVAGAAAGEPPRVPARVPAQVPAETLAWPWLAALAAHLVLAQLLLAPGLALS